MLREQLILVPHSEDSEQFERSITEVFTGAIIKNTIHGSRYTELLSVDFPVNLDCGYVGFWLQFNDQELVFDREFLWKVVSITTSGLCADELEVKASTVLRTLQENFSVDGYKYTNRILLPSADPHQNIFLLQFKRK